MEKGEPSYPIGGTVNWYSHYGEQYVGSLKNKNRATIWSSNPTPWHISRENHNSKRCLLTSLVAYWIRICLLMQGTRVRPLVQDDSTCGRATKPGCHNYWAHLLQLPKPESLEPMPCNKRSHHKEKPMHHNKEYPLLTSTRESPHNKNQWRPNTAKNKKIKLY